ncbi:ABC transporter ATP-binding protein [Corynebacterium kozikiae]|uniref:ABC transporter ATP-binding protein n=1 Tax=Corynebacterium kozikiae TaxID=2968469 RepID=UPI00211CE92D|nr:sn-glycerol-3-phosphate ABC transporter ATP-binding protein UgpC [Corynebacterium sp. 76QC2CO]
MASVSFENVTRTYQKGNPPAVDQLNLDIADGEFLVLVGPSGCGKSTSLRMLAGLEPTDAGRILINGTDATGLSPIGRDIAMVFQNYALYPNMTVAQNMGFALRNLGMAKSDVQAKVAEAAEMLELTPLLGRKPAQLSGGQRQRVAMGRAIVRDPAVFCMDEPLSNLDAKLRVSTRAQVSALQKRLGTTTVYVTHDQVEAMTMGDRVAVLKSGTLQQVAPPKELYNDPANAFVAGFIGSPAMNLFDTTLTEQGVALGNITVPITPQQRAQANGQVLAGVRPEHLRITESAQSTGLELKVSHVEELGHEAYAYCEHPTLHNTSNNFGNVIVFDPHSSVHEGQTIRVEVDPMHLYLFDATTGKRIR